MNLFQSILEKAKGGYNYLSSGQMGSDFYDATNNSDPTQTLQYKAINTISKPIQWTAENLQQGGQQLSDIAMKHAQNVQNKGYRDEGKIKQVVQHLIDKGYDQNTINQTVKNLDDQGAFQGSWINNPISGTLASVESGLSKGLGTMFQGISNVGSAPLQQNAGDALARYGKGAMETGLGAFQTATSLYPQGQGFKKLINPTINTLFSTDTAGKVLEPINKGLDIVGGGIQEALGFDSQSQASKDIRDIGTTAGNLALFHYGQKGAGKAYDVASPYIEQGGKKIIQTAENVAPKVTNVIKTGIQKVTPTAEGISTRANRFIAGDEQKFVDQIGETPGQFAVSRGMNEVGEKAIEKAQQNFEASKAEADKAFGMIEGKFTTKGQSNDIVGDLLRANMEKMKSQPRNKDRAMAESLYNKYENGEGLTMSEINEAKRIHARNHTYSYEQRTSNEARNASDIQNDIREWQFETAKQNGYTNADKVNMETKGWKMFADSLAKKMDRSGANNAIGITDWITLAGGNPTNIALFLGKKTAQSNLVKTGAIKLLGKKTKPTIIESSKADIQQANFQKNVNRGISNNRGDVGGESMVKPAGLLPEPSGKTTGAKNFRVNQQMGKTPIVNEGQKGARPTTPKAKEAQKLLPAPRIPSGTSLPRTDIAAESMRGVNSKRPSSKVTPKTLKKEVKPPITLSTKGTMDRKVLKQSPIAYEMGSMGRMKPIQPKRLFAGENAKAPPKTGWVKGADGKMRFEIDDSQAKIILNPIKQSEIPAYGAYDVKLGDVISHDELFKQYPEMREIPIRINPNMEYGGYYSSEGKGLAFKGISIQPEFVKGKEIPGSKGWKHEEGSWVLGENEKSILIHEIQHAIQNKEGFAKGGSMAKGMSEYKNMSGEVEARNVQSRMNLTASERKLKSPESTEDVPRAKQIVRMDSKGPMLSRGFTMGIKQPIKLSPDIDKKPYTLGIKKPIVKRSADIIDTSKNGYNSKRIEYNGGSVDFEITKNGIDIDKIVTGDKRKGIGSELLQRVETFAKENGIKKIQLSAQPLDSSISKEGLYSFYKKNGYTDMGDGLFRKILK